MRTRFRQLQDGSDGRIIFGKQLRPRNDLHLRSFWQPGLWRQHHHAVLDCAFEAHAPCLAQDARKRKRRRGSSLIRFVVEDEAIPVLTALEPHWTLVPS